MGEPMRERMEIRADEVGEMPAELIPMVFPVSPGGAKRVLPASEMTAADRAAYESWCALCGYEPRADGS